MSSVFWSEDSALGLLLVRLAARSSGGGFAFDDELTHGEPAGLVLAVNGDFAAHLYGFGASEPKLRESVILCRRLRPVSGHSH